TRYAMSRTKIQTAMSAASRWINLNPHCPTRRSAGIGGKSQELQESFPHAWRVEKNQVFLKHRAILKGDLNFRSPPSPTFHLPAPTSHYHQAQFGCGRPAQNPSTFFSVMPACILSKFSSNIGSAGK